MDRGGGSCGGVDVDVTGASEVCDKDGSHDSPGEGGRTGLVLGAVLMQGLASPPPPSPPCHQPCPQLPLLLLSGKDVFTGAGGRGDCVAHH